MQACVFFRERRTEREGDNFLSVSANAPPPFSSCCHGNSHQIRTSAIAFISHCPLAAYGLSVYMKSVMFPSQSPAVACFLISGHIPHNSAITYTAEEVRGELIFFFFNEQSNKRA